MTLCKKAPTDWQCTREEGHEGPCAAIHVPAHAFSITTGQVRLRTGMQVGMDTSVSILHIPSGIKVTEGRERSQHRNKLLAWDTLMLKLRYWMPDSKSPAPAHPGQEGVIMTNATILVEMTPLAMRKLQDLKDKGYHVNGVCFERTLPNETQPHRGFLDMHGFCGWHPRYEIIDWREVGPLMEAANSAEAKQFVVGTTNWAACMLRLMKKGKDHG